MAHKILIVDDGPQVCQTLQRLLTTWGYEVDAAEDGVMALRKLEKLNPSLVLLDIQMPRMGGIEFLKSALVIKPGLAVIMVTGSEDEVLAQAAMKLGASDYVVKPIDFSYLETSIKAKLAIGTSSLHG